MKELRTKDGVLIQYVKNEEKSINGVCNMFDLYNEESVLIGSRVGVRGLKDMEYKSLFTEAGEFISDPDNKLAKVKPRKERKAAQQVATQVTQVTPQASDPVKPKSSSPGTVSVDKLSGGGFETQLKFRVTLKTKTKVTARDVVSYLEQKWEVTGYEIAAQPKNLTKLNEEVGEEGE